MDLYVISSVTNGGNLTLEYKVVELKTDLRKKFCKENKNCIVSALGLISLIKKHNILVKDARLILENGKTAYNFSKDLKNILL